jgi:splicing suppressor protein 51
MPTQAPKSTYTPLSSAGSWYEYYTHISDKQMITGLLSPDLKPLAGNAEMASALTAATDKSTMILTIIAALEAVFSDLSTKSTINLHLIGATGKELDALMLFEEMLHLLPLLDELHCAFVGLEMPTPQNLGETLVLDCCPGCTEAGRIRSVEMWKGAYHDYIKTGNYSKPDLAVAFHTGHSQEMIEEWTPTIKYLVNADHCTVFTTFNEKEMMEETEILKGLGARFLVRGEKNKWKGMKPMLEVIEEIENSVYYNNQYWYSTSLVKAHPG